MNTRQEPGTPMDRIVGMGLHECMDALCMFAMFAVTQTAWAQVHSPAARAASAGEARRSWMLVESLLARVRSLVRAGEGMAEDLHEAEWLLTRFDGTAGLSDQALFDACLAHRRERAARKDGAAASAADRGTLSDLPDAASTGAEDHATRDGTNPIPRVRQDDPG